MLPGFGVIDLPVVHANKDQRQQPLLDVQIAKHVILSELLDRVTSRDCGVKHVVVWQ